MNGPRCQLLTLTFHLLDGCGEAGEVMVVTTDGGVPRLWPGCRGWPRPGCRVSWHGLRLPRGLHHQPSPGLITRCLSLLTPHLVLTPAGPGCLWPDPAQITYQAVRSEDGTWWNNYAPETSHLLSPGLRSKALDDSWFIRAATRLFVEQRSQFSLCLPHNCQWQTRIFLSCLRWSEPEPGPAEPELWGHSPHKPAPVRNSRFGGRSQPGAGQSEGSGQICNSLAAKLAARTHMCRALMCVGTHFVGEHWMEEKIINSNIWRTINWI